MEMPMKHVVAFIHTAPGRTVQTPRGPRQELILHRRTQEVHSIEDLMQIRLDHADDPRFRFDPPLEDWLRKSAVFVPHMKPGRPANDGRERKMQLSVEEPP